MEVFRNDNTPIPTLELKHCILPHTLRNYQALTNKKKQWIPCQDRISTVYAFTVNHWMERLYLERLEEKCL